MYPTLTETDQDQLVEALMGASHALAARRG
jgi:hypothetical protein